MAMNFQYTITEDMGLHARPAGLLAKKAKALSSKVTVSCHETTCDARKLIQLMSLEAQKGDTLDITVSGEAEETEAGELSAFLKEVL